jgi:hypothetical protein
MSGTRPISTHKSKFSVGDPIEIVRSGDLFMRRGTVQRVRRDGLLIVQMDSDPPGTGRVVSPLDARKRAASAAEIRADIDRAIAEEPRPRAAPRSPREPRPRRAIAAAATDPIMGRTRSGKPIFSDLVVHDLAGWTSQDHADAAEAHEDAATEARYGRGPYEVVYDRALYTPGPSSQRGHARMAEYHRRSASRPTRRS